MPGRSTDVTIIGAGPYGLSLAIYLRHRGIEHRIFGSPMHTWRTMPASLNLKSLGFATSIPTPWHHPTLPEYCRARGLEDDEPIEMATFAAYGMDVQRKWVPYVEDTQVTSVGGLPGQFQISLATGEVLQSRRVVVAVGLTHFQYTPRPLADLPSHLVTHSSQHSDYAAFAGTEVLVVGGGASALEAAALLHEQGARAQLVVRREVKWVGGGKKGPPPNLLQRIRMPRTVLGLGRDNWVLEHVPMLVHYLPTEHRLRLTRTHLGPSGPWWLRDRVVDKFPVHERTAIIAARTHGERVHLRVRDAVGLERDLIADHVVAGTGYQVDVDRMSFLASDLAASIRRTAQAPQLSRHFESSVAGLYFVGPAAAPSFGPLVRFVAGAEFAIPVVAGHLARRGSLASALRSRTVGIRTLLSSGARST